MTNKALIIVDAQYDFMEGGSLAVEGATAAMDRLAKLLSDEKAMEKYSIVITTQDWHIDPGEHWAAEGKTPNYSTTWPVHCAANTHGADIYEPLTDNIKRIMETGSQDVFAIHKGMNEAAYSGFEGVSVSKNGNAMDKVSLQSLLEENNVSSVDVVGLAYDFCVKATAVDAVNGGFDASILREYTASVNDDPAVLRDITESIESSGVTVVKYSGEATEYPPFALTVDLNIFTIRNNNLAILLVRRGAAPFYGKYALPGGFVNINETVDEAAARELQEETGVSFDSDDYLEQVKTYYRPNRDPRMATVSTAYIATVEKPVEVAGGDDAMEANWCPVEDILSGDIELAFDHKTIVEDALQRLRSKFEYTTVATTFLDSPFTLGDLRRVYEIVWGRTLHPSNFRRKVLSTSGFVVPTDSKGSSATGGYKASLYNRGDATLLHPAILNDTEVNS